MRRGSKPKWVMDVAFGRISRLIGLAECNKKKYPERSRRYVELARKISKRYNAPLSNEQKARFCKNCDSYFTADNSKVRIVPKIKATLFVCLECGFKKIYRHGS